MAGKRTSKREWRPFAEVREFARSLGLKGKIEWQEYAKSGKRPADIPSTPHHVYKTQWKGWKDWVGTQWRPFAEARKFVHGLGLNNRQEWAEYCKSGEKPADIPAYPEVTYKAEFEGVGHWLGTGAIAKQNRQYRPFSKARDFARELGLKSGSEWREYCKSGEKPDDIPAAPDRVYKAEFKGMGDWLGTGNVHRPEYRSFYKAREYTRSLGLKDTNEWRGYCKSGEKPDDIPASPHGVYKSQWKNWADWLGTGNARRRRHEWRPFGEAREFVHGLGLKSRSDWKRYCKSGEKPPDIPSHPIDVYDEYENWGDWIGHINARSSHREWRPFEEAREFVRGLELKNEHEWDEYIKTGKKPTDIPSRPQVVYRTEYRSMGDWLGTGYVRTADREYRSFSEAREFVRHLGVRGQDEWRAYVKSGNKPADIPSNPDRVYGPEFRGWGDWLGIVGRWSRIALLAFLNDLRPRLPYLEESELYTILQQGGVLRGLHVAFGKNSPMQVLKDLKANQGREMEQAIREALDDEIVAQADDEVADEGVADKGDLTALFENRIFESEDRNGADSHVHPGNINDTPITDVEKGLPTLTTPESLRVIDSLTELSCGLDDDAAEYLVANRVSALWERYINQGRECVDELLSGDGGRWFTEIKRQFLSEVEGVEDLVVPEGWSFTSNGSLASPNAMQRRAAWAVREKRRVGNWSGVGAGKTLSAVLASRVMGARLTLVVTNNATVPGWRRQIKEAYPESTVHTRVDDSSMLDRDHHNYVVLNYEKFQAPSRDLLVHQLLRLGVDFVVFDEVQLVKQRDRNATNRRNALEALVSGLAENNPALRVMGMSATPVINNLLEAKKLLEIVTGVRFAELDTQQATTNNALAVHRALMLHGFRYRPRYEQEMRTEIVTTTRNELLGPLRDLGRDVLGVEQLLLSAKLEVTRDRFRKGTIVYTHYVDGMVAPIRRYLEDMGLRVGLYTGADKSGLEPFLNGEVDILVGSRPVGTGLDGLQYVCDRLVMLCLPWTSAEYEQIIGRIRRQGSAFGEVEIIIPQIMLDHNGDTWSWDRGRMACIQYKRTLSDCAVDGYIPETVRINPNELLKQSREALERWIERIGEKGVLAIDRERLTVPLPSDVRQMVQVRHGDFTTLNRRWSTSRSRNTHERLREAPSEWYLYHTLYREARANWPEQPFERIAQRIRVRPDWVVGDFGCGECLLARALRENQVIGIDHVACDESVVECDMSATPLDDASLDVAVFSLSLMGTNWTDYLREAYRTLKPYGHLFVAEPSGKWQDNTRDLKGAVEEVGFRVVGDIEQRYSFRYLTAVKA